MPRMNAKNPELLGIADCNEEVACGTDPRDLVEAPGRLGADEALISALGRGTVLAFAGAPDDSDESWERFGLAWCKRYSAAYEARARKWVSVNELFGAGAL